MATTVTSKGQVTIPNAVEFALAADGRVVLVKVGGRRPSSRFEALRGRAGEGLSTDQIMALTRGEPEA